MKMMSLFCVLFLIVSCAINAESVSEEKTIPSVVAELTENHGLNEVEKLECIYYFVRDEIEFNWVYPQDIPAEEVLNNGYGVCMQKANLFAAMAQSSGFETRFHFIYVHKQALEDFLPDFAYDKWLDPFPHTVIEVKLENHWVSFDPSFDKTLHDICIDKKLNFGRYPEIYSEISMDFSPEGVVGAQQYQEAEGTEGFYGTDLQPLMDFDRENVPMWKRMLKPVIFRKAHLIMNNLRGYS